MKTKALIIANVGSSHFQDGIMLPSCLLKVYNDMTIIERLISLLNINGIPNTDICIQCGQNGVWESELVRNKIKSLGTVLIHEEKNNALNKELFSNKFFDDCNLILIEGNSVLDIAIISRIRRYRHQNVIVVNEMQTPDENGRMIVTNGNKIVSMKRFEETRYPWVAFAGVMKLSQNAVEAMNKNMVCSRDLMEIIEDSLSDVDFRTIAYEDLVYGKINGGYSEELTGGSYSKLNYRLVVRKESDSDGRDKLINEIKWLLSIPKDLKPYFSEVLEYDITSPKVFYNVPYYGSRNLREKIFDGHLDDRSASDFIESLLDWMFDNVYSRKISDAPEDWVLKKHIRRVLDRLPECSSKCPELGKIIASKKLVVNGIEYRNVKEIYSEFERMSELQKDLQPTELVMIHGDLHFQNILLTNETDTGFILVDPRGESKGSDIYYDLGKLWHSFHAKYDFIHSDQFEFEMSWDGDVPCATYTITNNYVKKVYEKIYDDFKKRILKYDFINKDPKWEMKVLFSEASHLCSVSTFHIGKTDSYDRPIVLYLIGVQLANEFYDRFIKGSDYLKEIQ